MTEEKRIASPTGTMAQRIQKRDFPDHECPETLERYDWASSAMRYHGQNEGWLMLATHLQTTCGCKVTGNGTLQHPLMIEPCEKHVLEMYDIPVEVLDRG